MSPSSSPIIVRSLAVLLGVLAFGLPAGGQAFDRANQLEQQRRNRQDQYRSMQNIVRNMQRLDTTKIEDVFQIRVEEKQLTVDLPLAKSRRLGSGQYRLEVDGLSGPTYIQLSSVAPFQHRGPIGRADDDGNDRTPTQTFSLLSFAMPTPDTLATVSVQSYPNYFHAEKNIQLNDGHWMIRLMEQRNPGLAEGSMVQLWVNRYGGGMTQPVNMNVQAADFPTLVREYPKEVEEYVRPLLRELGQEQLFAPDAHVAWQVLADYWTTDDEVARQVDRVLPDLDHADFRTRERALQKLLELDRPAAAVLMRLDRTGFSAERNLMIDRALAPYAQLPGAQTARLGTDVGFLIDCLYSDDQAIRVAAWKHLKKVAARDDLKFDPASESAAERYTAARELREELVRNAATPATQPTR